MILLDTNVLVYAIDASSGAHTACRRAVEGAMWQVFEAVLFPQVLTEFLAVVTSARRVASPLSLDDAMAQVTDWRRAIPVRYPTARCLDELTTLASERRRTGQDIHDLFLAAQMRAHGVDDICTVNGVDFKGIRGIGVVAPDSL